MFLLDDESADPESEIQNLFNRLILENLQPFCCLSVSYSIEPTRGLSLQFEERDGIATSGIQLLNRAAQGSWRKTSVLSIPHQTAIRIKLGGNARLSYMKSFKLKHGATMGEFSDEFCGQFMIHKRKLILNILHHLFGSAPGWGLVLDLVN